MPGYQPARRVKCWSGWLQFVSLDRNNFVRVESPSNQNLASKLIPADFTLISDMPCAWSFLYREAQDHFRCIVCKCWITNLIVNKLELRLFG
jgi:hypothetical protein